VSRIPNDSLISGTDGRLAVVRLERNFAVLAARPLHAGEELLELQGCLTDRPSRYSVQIGASEHVDAPPGAPLETLIDEHPWRFLNHACRPNAVFRGRRLVALRAIEPWVQVTFDYSVTEYELATPFRCGCAESGCCGWVRGFRHLSAEAREARRAYLPEYLARLLQADGAPAP
jgi:hypothetical protein